MRNSRAVLLWPSRVWLVVFMFWACGEASGVGVITFGKDPHGNNGARLLVGRIFGPVRRTNVRARLMRLNKGLLHNYTSYCAYFGAGSKGYTVGASPVGRFVRGTRRTSNVVLTSPACCNDIDTRVGTFVSQLKLAAVNRKHALAHGIKTTMVDIHENNTMAICSRLGHFVLKDKVVIPKSAC